MFGEAGDRVGGDDVGVLVCVEVVPVEIGDFGERGVAYGVVAFAEILVGEDCICVC